MTSRSTAESGYIDKREVFRWLRAEFFESPDTILLIWSDRLRAELDLTRTVIYAIFRASSVVAFCSVEYL
jgi:hypothetical protein